MSPWKVLVSLAALALLLVFVPLDGVVAAIGRIGAGVLVASLCGFLAGHVLNAVKLRLLIGWDAVPMRSCVRAQFAGIAAGIGLPGVSGGDVVRGLYLSRTAGAARVVVASVADRAIDTVVLVLLVAAAVPTVGLPAALGFVRGAGWWAIAGAIGIGLLVIAVRRMRRRGAVSGRAVVAAMAISFAVQSVFVLINVWMAGRAGVQVGLAPWFVAWPLAKLVAVLPVSLGGLGVREAALVSLMVPFGAPRDAVLASGILWQGVVIAAAVLGLLASILAPAPGVSRTPPSPSPDTPA